MKIKVDYREPSEIAEELQKLGYEIETTTLKVGDYKVGWWVIERKTYSDFISSRNSKRLYVQIAELVRSCQKRNLTPCLMVENDFNHSFEESRIIELHCRTLGKDIWTIPTQPKTYEWSTAKTIHYYAQKILKGKMAQGIRRPQEIIGNQDNKIQVLCSWPNISEVRAKKLIEKFKSPKRILNNIKLWKKVEGIGPKTIEKCFKLWESP